MAESDVTELEFLDEASLSQYACDTCHKLPKCSLRSQCCGAVYCKKCAEVAESNAVIAAEQNKNPLGNVRMNLRAIVCIRCKMGNLRLLLDGKMQESINQLQVKCLKPGCGWTGDYGSSEAHLKEPHDSPEDIYDNDVLEGDMYVDPVSELDRAVEMLYEDPNIHPEEEIYDDPQDQPEDDYVDTTLPQQDDQKDELYVDTLAEADEQIYDNDPPSRPAIIAEDSQAWILPPPESEMTAKQLAFSTFSTEQDSQEGGGPTRKNMLLRLYRNTHREDFADLTTSEKLLYVAGVLTASLWIFLTLTMVVISLLSSAKKGRGTDGLFTPQCGDYSPGLLWIVVLVHLAMLAFLAFWLGRCRVCRGRKTNRVLVSALFILTIIYGVSVVGFSASVFGFVNESRNSTTNEGDRAVSGNSSLTNTDMSESGANETDGVNGSNGTVMGSTMNESNGTATDNMVNGNGEDSDDCEGGMGSGSKKGDTKFNETMCAATTKEHPCVSVSSESFTLVMAFICLLVLFMAALSCLLGHECSHNECCYQREIYDPDVIVMGNETTV